MAGLDPTKVGGGVALAMKDSRYVLVIKIPWSIGISDSG